MRGSDEDSGAKGGSDEADEDPAVLAEELFARLIQHGVERRNGARTAPAAAPYGGSRAGPAVRSERPPPERLPQAEYEVRQIAAAALAATDRIGEVVDVVGSQVDATSTALADLGRAMEQALAATNQRLAALEQALLGEAGPGAEGAKRAMSRLRRTVGRTGEGGRGTIGQ